MDVRRRFLASWQVEIASARRARADEDRVIALLEDRAQTVHPVLEVHDRTKRGNVADFLVDHRFRQAKARDL